MNQWRRLSEDERLDWLAFDYRRQDQIERLSKNANKLAKDSKLFDPMTYLIFMLQAME